MRQLMACLAALALLAPTWAQDLKTEVGQMVQEAIDAGDMPGAIVGLWHDGRWVLRETYGKRAVEPAEEPMTIDTVFDMASITKPVATATSAMMLVQDGRLDLNARVVDYLKDFTGDGRDDLRVWHLLTHSGGLIPDNALSDYQSGEEEAWRRLMKMDIKSTPGSKFVYSDVSFQLLGKVVETISGQSLKEFSSQRVFKPLGMRDSGYVPDQQLIPRVAPTEARKGTMLRGEVHDPRAALLSGIAGHAGLFSTLDDLALYAQMMLRNGRLPDGQIFMRPDIVWTMTRPYTIETKADFGPVSRTRGWDHHSGFSYNGGRELSTSAFGHGGFTGTVLWIDPDQNLFFVFLSSRLHPDGKGSVNQLAGKIATLAVKQIKDAAQKPKPTDSTTLPPVMTGIDTLATRDFRDLAGKRVALVTNQTGIDHQGRTTLSLLSSSKNVNLVALFSPEHGIEGKLDVNKISDARDATLNVPIYSLYGETRKPKPEQLAGVDVLVYDIQDIGTRFYTYIATMKNCLEACAEQHKEFMVLDRPNPIGDRVAGPMRQLDRSTFVACHHLPVQHGMTVGELALLFAREGKLDIVPTVMPVRGWKHSDRFETTGQWWLNPSPNMRTIEAARLYPGIGLLEMTNISVGRGTDRPFQWIGAPWMDGQALSVWLNAQKLLGVLCVPRKMTPDSSKHSGVECSGVQFVISDIDTFDAIQLGLTVARGLVQLHAKSWESQKLDVLVVNQEISNLIAAGTDYAELSARIEKELAEFKVRRASVLLYD
ncbi:MAG: DUF1343 domain-containing protein [Pirellulaceae bacterium]|nr:DUF1343 domain-containing protein [Pirellulaceae bacterium]